MHVLFEDNHLLVVMKPPGVLSQADITGDVDMLTRGKAYIGVTYKKPGGVYLGLVHRLDRPASGVMVFARTSKAAGRLSEQFRNRTVTKEYVALAGGTLTGSGTWTDRLEKVDGMVRVVEKGGKEARLDWTALGRVELDGVKQASMIHVDLGTGRAHQIRVQAASRGHALIGDFKYGSRTPLDGSNLGLHAIRLSFDHPTLKTRMTFTAPPPESWPREARDIAESWLALNPVR